MSKKVIDEGLEGAKSGDITSSHLVKPFISGLISSTVTTITYQPLELLKTRIQITDREGSSQRRIHGRLIRTAWDLTRKEGISYLWRGTGASLLRSGPGVSLYYATLGLLQTRLSEQTDKPDSATQAFCFGIAARSLVSFVLLPVTVVKVRYESGRFNYTSLAMAIKSAYIRDGWIGVSPTVLRDSLFSGFYYMIYTQLKSSEFIDQYSIEGKKHAKNFFCGLISGVVASVATNPLDVLKTRLQVQGLESKTSIRTVVNHTLSQPRGYLSLFDGVVPRGIRRTLIAATTWTIYELVSEEMKT